MVGTARFELATFCPPDKRANQAALRSDVVFADSLAGVNKHYYTSSREEVKRSAEEKTQSLRGRGLLWSGREGDERHLGRTEEADGEAIPDARAARDVEAHGVKLVESGDEAVVEAGDERAEKRHHAAVGVAGQQKVRTAFGREFEETSGKPRLVSQGDTSAVRRKSRSGLFGIGFGQTETAGGGVGDADEGQSQVWEVAVGVVKHLDVQLLEQRFPGGVVGVVLVVSGDAQGGEPRSEVGQGLEAFEALFGGAVDEVAVEEDEIGLEAVGEIDHAGDVVGREIGRAHV